MRQLYLHNYKQNVVVVFLVSGQLDEHSVRPQERPLFQTPRETYFHFGVQIQWF